MKQIDVKELLELLNFGRSNGTIEMDDEALIELVKMKRIQKVKAIHNHPVYSSEKSGWTTYVDDPTMKSGKRNFRRATEDGLWDALSKWYLENERQNKITLKEIYPEWLEWKRTPTNAENIKRIEAAWQSYYMKEPLSKDLVETPLKQITSLMLRKWAESLLKKHYPVDQQKFSRMFCIINGCMEYAADEDVQLIEDNLWQKANKKINRRLMGKRVKSSDDEQVFTDEQKEAIWLMVYDDLKKYSKQSSSAGLQVCFMFETGLRIGECCGLKWSDIKGNRLYIQRQANNEGVREWTKTDAGYRDIPLTHEARRLLDDIRVFNEMHGYTREWIFQGDNPEYDYRLGYNAADRKLRKLCKRLDTPAKSPHKLRKTCISTLLDDAEVNERTIQRFAGHKDPSTTHRYYSCERKTKEQQADAIEKALSHNDKLAQIQRLIVANSQII